MKRAFLTSASALIASMSYGQTLPAAPTPVPNVQTGEVPPVAAAPEVPPDTRAITQPDSGSSIDKPPIVSPEPETGYHAPVIPLHKSAKPLPHEQMREATIPPAANVDSDCTPARRGGCRSPRRR